MKKAIILTIISVFILTAITAYAKLDFSTIMLERSLRTAEISGDIVKTVDGTKLIEKEVLYRKDGTEIIISQKITDLAELDKQIADLQAKRAELLKEINKLK